MALRIEELRPQQDGFIEFEANGFTAESQRRAVVRQLVGVEDSQPSRG